MKKTVLSLLMGLVLSFCSLNSIQAASGFSDVSMSTKYYEAITFIQDRGIVEGYEDGTYKPNKVLTRAELLKIIMEASFVGANFEQYADDDCFDDVRNGDWYVKYVCFAKTRQMVSGYPETNDFRPNNTVNFVEALKITLGGFEYKIESDPDVWYKSYVDAAAERNFIPLDVKAFEQEFTRGQMADMITRIIKFKENTLVEYLGNNAKIALDYEGIKNGGITSMISECVAGGESLGPDTSMNDSYCCEGLVPYIPEGANGTKGICVLPDDMMEDGMMEEDMMEDGMMEEDMMEEDMMSDMSCVHEGEDLGPWAEGNNAMCCTGLTEVSTETGGDMMRTCQMFEEQACVAEGESLGRYVEGNEAMCCPGLEEKLEDSFGNKIEYNGMRGVCAVKTIDVGLPIGPFQPIVVEFDVEQAACVEMGGNLGMHIAGNNSMCCAGLVPMNANTDSRGICMEAEILQCVGEGGSLGPDLPSNQSMCCEGTEAHMSEVDQSMTCEESIMMEESN